MDALPPMLNILTEAAGIGNYRRSSCPALHVAKPQLYKYKKKLYCEDCYSFSWNTNPKMAHTGTCCVCGKTVKDGKYRPQQPSYLTHEERDLIAMAKDVGATEIVEQVEGNAKASDGKRKRAYRRSRRNRR